MSEPWLEAIPLSEVESLSEVPTPKIKTDHDLEQWKSMPSYRTYLLFLRHLNYSVLGTSLPWIPEHRSQVWLYYFFLFFWLAHLSRKKKQKSVDRLLALLHTLEQWIVEIPPLQSPQRFGNLAFRTWGQRLEEVGFSYFQSHHKRIKSQPCLRGVTTSLGRCWHLNMLWWYPTLNLTFYLRLGHSFAWTMELDTKPLSVSFCYVWCLSDSCNLSLKKNAI